MTSPLWPDQDPSLLRSDAFKRQCTVLREAADKLWQMREWGRADSNMDLIDARSTLRALLGETTLADFIRKDAA